MLKAHSFWFPHSHQILARLTSAVLLLPSQVPVGQGSALQDWPQRGAILPRRGLPQDWPWPRSYCHRTKWGCVPRTAELRSMNLVEDLPRSLPAQPLQLHPLKQPASTGEYSLLPYLSPCFPGKQAIGWSPRWLGSLSSKPSFYF